jgi:hypothetical protein
MRMPSFRLREIRLASSKTLGNALPTTIKFALGARLLGTSA